MQIKNDPHFDAVKARIDEELAQKKDASDWEQYVPKPDYEEDLRRTRRDERTALLGDIAQLASQAYAANGGRGGWMVNPLTSKYDKARATTSNLLAQKKAAWQDYKGKKFAFMEGRRKERAAQRVAAANAAAEQNRFDTKMAMDKYKADTDATIAANNLAYKRENDEANRKNQREIATGRNAATINAAQIRGGGNGSKVNIRLSDDTNVSISPETLKNNAAGIISILQKTDENWYNGYKTFAERQSQGSGTGAGNFTLLHQGTSTQKKIDPYFLVQYAIYKGNDRINDFIKNLANGSNTSIKRDFSPIEEDDDNDYS